MLECVCTGLVACACLSASPAQQHISLLCLLEQWACLVHSVALHQQFACLRACMFHNKVLLSSFLKPACQRLFVLACLLLAGICCVDSSSDCGGM